MSGAPLCVILLPTLDCNVACDYCFQERSRLRLSIEDLPRLTALLLDHMEERGNTEASVYWQGGEVMLLGPAWFERAHAVMAGAASARGLAFRHFLQTNLIGWNPRWHDVTRTMFGGSLGTSMDFPNRHRRLRNGSADRYTKRWLEAVGEARAAGFSLGVISVLHPESLEAGPEAFYDFFTREAGITDFQVNMPFPGGPGRGAQTLAPEPLSRFLTGLTDIWMDRGLPHGIRLGPFDELVNAFSGRPARLPCIWQPNCAHDFLAVDARGQAALCDCWVASYPGHAFGNVFGSPSIGDLLRGSKARQQFLERPQRLMEGADCATCSWLSLCHGGCPVRTFTALGTVMARDPYCETYRALFAHVRKITAEAVGRRLALLRQVPQR